MNTSFNTGGNMSFGTNNKSIASDEGTPKAKTQVKGLGIVGNKITNDF